MPNPLLHPRGTHPSVPAYLSTEGDCVSEIGMSTWMKEIEATQTKKVAYVQTLTGTSKRLVVPVWMEHQRKVIKVFVDIVTGTAYTEEGKCLSSNQLQIIKWGKSIAAGKRKEKKEFDADEIRKIQRSWASGGLGK